MDHSFLDGEEWFSWSKKNWLFTGCTGVDELCYLCFVLKVISLKTQWSYQLLYLFIYIFMVFRLSVAYCVESWYWLVKCSDIIGRGCSLIWGTAISFAWLKWQKPQKNCQNSNSLYLDLNLIPLFAWQTMFCTYT